MFVSKGIIVYGSKSIFERGTRALLVSNANAIKNIVKKF